MPTYYRRPGVYLEESLLINPSDVAGTFTAGAFVGAAGKGPVNEPTLVQSWSDYVTIFGDLKPITQPAGADPYDVTSRLTTPIPANLSAIQAHNTYGNGGYTGAAFTAGQYVTLGDGSKANYAVTVSTNRRAAAPGQSFDPDSDITASDSTNAAKLAGGTAEVQTVTPGGTISGGSFTLTLPIQGGVVTGPIQWNATAANVKTAIDAALTGNTITVGGGPVNTTAFTLTFTGYGDIGVTTVQSSLTGTTPALTVATTTPGVGEGFTAAPTSAWTTGQNIWVGAFPFYWNGTAWTAGTGGGGTPKANGGVWASGPFAGTTVPPPAQPKILSYLPFAVYSFFQNGGRVCWVIRATPTDAPQKGVASSVPVNGPPGGSGNLTSFVLKARSPGVWGNGLKYALSTQSTVGSGASSADVFALQILMINSEGNDEVVETFPSLSIAGEIPGTRRIDSVINDSAAGSLYVTVSNINEAQPQPAATTDPTPLSGGVDPALPQPGDLQSAALQITKVDGPLVLNIVGYLTDASLADSDNFSSGWQSTTVPSTSFLDRTDIMVINDSAGPRDPGTSSSVYKSQIATALGANTGDSRSASYGPWIIVPNPSRAGTTVSMPPGGAVMGMMARIDATVGVFRAPAGVIAGLSNAVGVQSKFTDTELGDLNNQNINIIRSVVGAGICVMGGRTRKTYNADRYISARRTLIYVEEVLKRSTQFAVFENNDQRLWSSLRMSAERILRPLWEAGGLSGSSTNEAYYITCDDTINTPAVIQSGEVRMEIGVALEYPAEFVVIRITQFDQTTFATEVQPAS